MSRTDNLKCHALTYIKNGYFELSFKFQLLITYNSLESSIFLTMPCTDSKMSRTDNLKCHALTYFRKSYNDQNFVLKKQNYKTLTNSMVIIDIYNVKNVKNLYPPCHALMY